MLTVSLDNPPFITDTLRISVPNDHQLISENLDILFSIFYL